MDFRVPWRRRGWRLCLFVWRRAWEIFGNQRNLSVSGWSRMSTTPIPSSHTCEYHWCAAESHLDASHLSVDGAQVTKWVPRDASHLQDLTFGWAHSELKSVKGTHMKITSANWTLERNSEKPERLHQEGRHQAPGWLHQSSTVPEAPVPFWWHQENCTRVAQQATEEFYQICTREAPWWLHQSGTTGTRRVAPDRILIESGGAGQSRSDFQRGKSDFRQSKSGPTKRYRLRHPTETGQSVGGNMTEGSSTRVTEMHCVQISLAPCTNISAVCIQIYFTLCTNICRLMYKYILRTRWLSDDNMIHDGDDDQ